MSYDTSKRVLIPVAERERQALKEAEQATLKNYGGKNKVAQWLAEPNTKAFNKILLDKAFSNHIPFTSHEDLKNELYKYFNTCYSKDIVPTISTLCTWLGVHRDTIYSTIANKGTNSDVLSQALNICHSIQENGAIAGSINSVLYMFLAKNYYGLNDNSTINLTSTLQDNTINNSNTMKVIQEQILEEEKEK